MHINKIKNIIQEDGIIFLTYGGFLSQSLITGMTEALEKEAEYSNLKLGAANNIFTIFIELTQNMMNYSKSRLSGDKLRAEGLILVGKEDIKEYFIFSQNIISMDDKERLEVKLKEVSSLDKDGLKRRYRELRREGRDMHHKGAGIGFYEIAKRSDKLEYDFEKISEDKYYFNFRVSIVANIKEKDNK